MRAPGPAAAPDAWGVKLADAYPDAVPDRRLVVVTHQGVLARWRRQRALAPSPARTAAARLADRRVQPASRPDCGREQHRSAAGRARRTPGSGHRRRGTHRRPVDAARADQARSARAEQPVVVHRPAARPRDGSPGRIPTWSSPRSRRRAQLFASAARRRRVSRSWPTCATCGPATPTTTAGAV